MMRRMQRKDVEEKKITQRAAIKAAADSEQRDKAQIDPEELERIRKRQAGVQVTAASFVAWKIKFDAEMAAKGTAVTESTDNQKLSGKQFFLAQQAAGGGANNDEEALILEGEGEFDDEALQRGLLAAMGELDDDDDDEDYVDGDEDDDEEEDYEEEESQTVMTECVNGQMICIDKFCWCIVYSINLMLCSWKLHAKNDKRRPPEQLLNYCNLYDFSFLTGLAKKSYRFTVSIQSYSHQA